MSDKIAVYIDGENISCKLYNLIEETIKEFGIIFIFNIYTKKGSKVYENWNKISDNCNIIGCKNKPRKNYVDSILIQEIRRDLKKYDFITLFFIVADDKGYISLKPIIEKKRKNIKFIGQKNKTTLTLNGKIIRNKII